MAQGVVAEAELRWGTRTDWLAGCGRQWRGNSCHVENAEGHEPPGSPNCRHDHFDRITYYYSPRLRTGRIGAVFQR